jgi:hypothetical protein
MRSRGAFILTAGPAAIVLIAAAGALCAAEAPEAAAVPDAAAIREAACGRVCLVTAENALGVPLAYASGFLLGEGRFAITDLASLVRTDVKQARLQFRDGSKAGATLSAVATQFGMADPATGLVAVRVDQLPAGLSGLTLSTASAAEGSGEVAVVGHKWGQNPDKPDIIIGQFSHATTAADLAVRLKIDPPRQAVSFFNFANVNPDEASGSPVLDRSGNVAGVLLRIAGVDKPLVVPASAIRDALMASDRTLKPLAELPKPLWPIAVLPVPGKPATAGEFAQTLRTIKMRSLCSQCKGKGTITVRKLIKSDSAGGIVRSTYKDEVQTCPTCKGEGVNFPDGLYAQYVRLAEAGTWLASAGGVDPKVRDTVFSNCLDLLRGIGKIGKGYRDDLAGEIKADLSKGGAAGPHGMVVYAQVRESVDGPDGAYVLLSPHGSGATYAAKADRMAAAAEVRGTRLDEGRWIIVAGMAMGPVSLGSQHPTYLQPFAWADGPSFGPHLHRPGGPGTPGTPPPAKPPGSPTFFGL